VKSCHLISKLAHVPVLFRGTPKTCILVVFNKVLGFKTRVVAQIFDFRALTTDEFGGWVTALAFLLAEAGPTSIAFVFLVGKAKRCADFAATLFIAHTIATIVHSGWPTTLAWWGFNGAATVAMACVSEWLSMRLELRDIAIPNGYNAVPANDKQAHSTVAKAAEELQDPEDAASRK
jgi:hypothetical protein